MTILAFVVNYQRLTLPAQMADWLAAHNELRVVIIDNDSDYPPLLEYYEETPHEVLRLDMNYGSAAPFHPVPAVVDKYGIEGNFIVTDPDLDTTGIPGDWLSVLREGLAKYDFACKAGFSLKIDDLPNTEIGNQARKVEAGYWNNPLDDGRFYRAYIDTTFCLLRKNYHDFAAVRAAPPYCARHVPWYYSSLDSIPEDELYYIRSPKSRGSTYWTGRIADEFGVDG